MSPRRLFAVVMFLAGCSTAPATNSPCEFENAAWCDDEGMLAKVCYPSSPPAVLNDLRWLDAPAPRSSETTCACAPDPRSGAPSAWCTTVQVDVGSLCVTPTAAQWKGGTIAADQPIYVHVHRPGCLSGSCSRDIIATCAIQRDGNTLRIASHFSASEPVAAECTADCRIPTADCISEPLPAGQYELVLGRLTVPLSIPTTVSDLACMFR